MKNLKITLIDVGWGDSILVEARGETGPTRFGLVDCNDREFVRSSHTYIGRHLEREGFPVEPPVFEFILLTHYHADHYCGLSRIISDYGTKRLLFPNSIHALPGTALLRQAKRRKIALHAIDDHADMPAGLRFGDVGMQFLWPRAGRKPSASNENLNSIVCGLTLGQVTFVLTGDAEASVWPHITLPAATAVLQIPHHGAENGTFTDAHTTPWLDQVDQLTRQGRQVHLAASCHIKPHSHPDAAVVKRIETARHDFSRTDQHHHITFATDGKKVRMKRSVWD